MRPIKLTLENFGPFQQAEVDFETFATQENASLFLITGQTGSGKTTLFDALCFSLYGATSGGKRDPKEMRSQFATTEETKVSLLFEAKGRQFVITRKPEQWLPKKKGNGVTKRVPFAGLVEYRNGKMIASEEGIQLVNQKILDLVELTLDEFSQIILLPQGEFRKFLNSDSNQKEEVLRRLFQTNLYEEMAKELFQRYKEEEKKTEALRQKQAFLLKDLPDKTETSSLEDLVAYLEEVKKIASLSHENWQKEQKNYHDLENKHQQNCLQQKKRETYQQGLEQLKKLEEKQQEIKKVERTIAEIELVSKLLPYQQELKDTQEKKAELFERIKEETKLLTRVAEDLDTLKNKKGQAENQKEEITGLEKESHHLEENLSHYLSYQKRQEEAEISKEKVATYMKEELHLKEKIEKDQLAKVELENKQIASHQRLENQRLLFEKKENLTNRQKKFDEAWHLAKEIKEKEEHYQQLLTAFKEEEKKYQEVKKAYQDVSNKWRLLEIARLSLELTEGTPCPICGSKEHPHPYQAEKGNIKEVEATQASLEKKEQVKKESLLQHQTQLTSLKESLEERKAELNGYLEHPQTKNDFLNPQELLDAKKELQQQIKENEKQEEEQKNLADTLLSLNNQWEKDEFNYQTVKEKRRESQKEAAVKEEQVQFIQNSLQEKYLHVPVEKIWQQMKDRIQSYYQQLERLQQKISQQEKEQLLHTAKLTSYKEQVENITLQIERKETFFLAELKENHLTLPQFEETAEIVQSLEKLKNDVHSYYETFNQQKGFLQELKKELTTTPMQLEKEAEELQNLKETLKEKEESYYEEKSKEKVLKEAVEKYQQIAAEIDGKMEHLKNIKELSDLARGEKPFPISLERFVLQQKFKEVLQKANEKLRYLSKGRYTFLLNNEESSAKKYSGLELDIYDDYTGDKRRVQTLSGGESFIAALALSLGLGEVIQMKAGGIAIELLLIDEGFGTLDEESLEMAINSLETIETNGRTIGIISHVKELRQRIPMKLQVVSLENGKSIIKNMPLAGESK